MQAYASLEPVSDYAWGLVISYHRQLISKLTIVIYKIQGGITLRQTHVEQTLKMLRIILYYFYHNMRPDLQKPGTIPQELKFK